MCDCKHAYWRKGIRSYGGNIPDSCQGAYFPGDEPGYFCKLSCSRCENENGDMPEFCLVQEETDKICPKCKSAMKQDAHGNIFCPECLHINYSSR